MTAQRLRVDKRSSVSLLILFLIVGFLGAVVFTLVRHRGAVRQEEAIKAANAANKSFESAQDLVGLDDGEAREKLALGKESLDRAVRFGLSTRRAGELEDFYVKVHRQILKIVDVDVESFYRFKKNSVSDFAFDYTKNSLVFIDIDKNQLKELTALDTNSVQESVLSESVPAEHRGVIFTDVLVGSWGESGFRVQARSGGVGGEGSFEESWKVTDVYGFSNWVYTLSSDSEQIFKFYNTGGQSFASSPWLGADVPVHGDSLLGIDGDVYVWSDTLYKFTKGRETDFYLRLNLDTKLENVQDLVVWPGGSFIYLLDSVNGRILQVTKEGLLENQYVSEHLKGARSLAVHAEETKAFVLTDTAVLEVVLR